MILSTICICVYMHVCISIYKSHCFGGIECTIQAHTQTLTQSLVD